MTEKHKIRKELTLQIKNKPIRLFIIIITACVGFYLFGSFVFTVRIFIKNKYPNFVYDNVDFSQLGVPVFLYHTIGPNRFEKHLKYLRDNGYYTLSTDEFYDYLQTGKVISKKSAMITFDDGRGSLWSIVYPLLKKYNMRATAFIIPGEMSNGRPGLSLEDYWNGDDEALVKAFDRDTSENPFITWEETKIMFESGLIDFQSHTLQHTKIFTSPEIIDFINPKTPYHFNNDNIPVLMIGGKDFFHLDAELGTPIYSCDARMSARPRFFDDESLRQMCINYVKRNGGLSFFQQNWKQTLHEAIEIYKTKYPLQGRFETVQEQKEAILNSLLKSKELIEQYLPGHQIKHLAYPWGKGSTLARDISRQAGYITNFVASGDGSIECIKPWHDPYSLVRLPDKEELILSLPGANRVSFLQRFLVKWFRILLSGEHILWLRMKVAQQAY